MSSLPEPQISKWRLGKGNGLVTKVFDGLVNILYMILVFTALFFFNLYKCVLFWLD